MRLSVAAILQGVGVPVSVGWDYGGLLSLENCYSDLSLMIVCSNWSLRHLKLTFLQSIDNAAASYGQKVGLRKSFQKEWANWLSHYLKSSDGALIL